MPHQRAVAIKIERRPNFFFNLMDGNPFTIKLTVLVFEEMHPATVHEVREAVVTAGMKRVRPAMMTTAVAVIALLPVLSSTGKGADIMVPMAIPLFGGMIIQVMTVFVVPLFQAMWREGVVRKNNTEDVQTFNYQPEDEENSI